MMFYFFCSVCSVLETLYQRPLLPPLPTSFLTKCLLYRALNELYSQESVLGEAARLLLAPPTRVTTLERTLDGSPPRRRQGRLGPRLSLRIFANKQILLYLLLLVYLMSWFLGSGLLFAALVLLMLASLLVLGMAAAGRLKSVAKGQGLAFLPEETLDSSKAD
jgi:hypothetical protein